jgi:hypothetical protein
MADLELASAAEDDSHSQAAWVQLAKVGSRVDQAGLELASAAEGDSHSRAAWVQPA